VCIISAINATLCWLGNRSLLLICTTEDDVTVKYNACYDFESKARSKIKFKAQESQIAIQTTKPNHQDGYSTETMWPVLVCTD